MTSRGFRINQYGGNAAATAKRGEAHLGNPNSLTEDLTESFTAKNIALLVYCLIVARLYHQNSKIAAVCFACKQFVSAISSYPT